MRTKVAWNTFISRLCEQKHDLIVLDTFSSIWGRKITDDERISNIVYPGLWRLTNKGKSVLLLHHTVKNGNGSVDSILGSAFVAKADSLITLTLGGKDETDPRRVLNIVGGGSVKPRKITYTLDADEMPVQVADAPQAPVPNPQPAKANRLFDM